MLKDATAIAGIAETRFAKRLEASECQLAAEAIVAALADAGIEPSEVDGMASYTMETTEEVEVAKNIGAGDITFFGKVGYGGGGGPGVVGLLAMAVATGRCRVGVAWRSRKRGSGQRPWAGAHDHVTAASAWTRPWGLLRPVDEISLLTRRYMHEYGATSEDFGRVSVADRRHAATNPKAWFYQQPITLSDHQSSRWIVEPLRLLDCCQESDGAVALVVTSMERARDLRQTPVRIAAAAQGATTDQQMMTRYYSEDITGLPEMGFVARQLYETAGIGPEDVQTAILYDHFTPFVLTQIEEFGFCGRGEAKDFIRDGNIELGGRLPINTNGGQLGEAYIHGMNGIAEGVRQVRGSSVNQVDDVEHVIVTAGTGVPTSGLILGA